MALRLTQAHELLVASLDETGMWLGGDLVKPFPWKRLRNCQVYATDELSLLALLQDAADRGYMVLDGASNERRGLRGFVVGIGAWGHAGKVHVRSLDSWAISTGEGDGNQVSGSAQRDIRALCTELNQSKYPFKPTALAWLGSVKRKLAIEPELSEFPEPLPESVALFCRAAHIGGPVLHCRTTLSPYVRLDRKRAYGNAMIDPLPCGAPAEISISPKNSLARWRDRDLRSAFGFVEATVSVFEGPFVPLLPVMRWHSMAKKTQTLHPTGMIRGRWTIAELRALEEEGRGEVKELHRAILFEGFPVYRPVIKYIRKVEILLAKFGVRVKRLEHMLYGTCARSLSIDRFSTGYIGGQALLGDLLSPQVLRRLGPDATVRNFSGLKGSLLPIYRVQGTMKGAPPHGTLDRPDRAAWITSHNRIALGKVITVLDEALKPEQSGDYIGRIYVDGLDIQRKTEPLPSIPGLVQKGEGDFLQLYRAGVTVGRSNGKEIIEAAGIALEPGATHADLLKMLPRFSDFSDGPFAGGRHWPNHPSGDPRTELNQRSEPMHVDLALLGALGFLEAPK